MNQARSVVVWIVLSSLVIIPLVAAALSPLLAWRQPIYIGAGFAGIFAFALLLFQPLLAIGVLPGISRLRGRLIHQWVGISLMLAVVAHVIGLWVTSPPDVIDALLFRSPTPFSAWGVVAMWAVFASVCLVFFRRKLRLRPGRWRIVHKSLATVIVVGSVVHAVLIEGTMEIITKSVLCASVLAALGFALGTAHTQRNRQIKRQSRT
ncbi:MAG: ferric reductase-like transmembrane domain-containing protein [Pseudomonadota bacterium]